MYPVPPSGSRPLDNPCYSKLARARNPQGTIANQRRDGELTSLPSHFKPWRLSLIRTRASILNSSRTVPLQDTVPYPHPPSSGFLNLASHAAPTTLLHALHQPTPTTLPSSPLLSTLSIPSTTAPTPRGSRIHRHQANFETRRSTLLTHIIPTPRAVAHHYCTGTRPAAPLTSRLSLVHHR